MGGRVGAFNFDRVIAMAEQLEEAGQELLDFSCTIMVLGKTGVGKSATINSIFDDVKFGMDAFELGTKKVLSELSRRSRFGLDMQGRDFGDLLLLRTITVIFGPPSIWFNAIVVLIHTASAPPELMNPDSLVENHSACRMNRAGQRVLPNGQVWKLHLLLLSFASKILAEANTLLKLQDNPPGKAFATRTRAPPLPFLLSSLLQSRPQLKLPEEQFGDDDGLDNDLDESSDSDNESEYDKLPLFKMQLKEEKLRRKMMKKHAALAKDLASIYSENVEEESGDAASVPVPILDLALPASFDSDNPTHCFRHLDSPNQWVVRPVLDLGIMKLIMKDKKDANPQMEMASSVKHGEGKATSLGFDRQTLGKDMAYTPRSETRFSNYRRNKATMGLSATLLGDALTAGLKVEDKLIVNKRLGLVVSGGVMTGRNNVAYGVER
ncbi:multimeric translocon complex in the outer envelope membrane 132 [Actinidia rufa]|uniref:Multimeric translocon complex in the outer envelope membrane 132 n=1 Tax=Actinidia rufa TaxID=165716 RepID=A0A7J0FQ84_9ERIC|nr:multimeric translocon complex in the outer envelope membrane 132 [Actinidia rufa]